MPVIDMIEHVLDMDCDDINGILTDIQNKCGYLKLTWALFYERLYLKKLFDKHNKGRLELTQYTSRIQHLYSLTNNSEEIKTAILGLLALQIKLSAIKSHPEEYIILKEYDTDFITKLPKSEMELFKILLVLIRLCKDLNINVEVFGTQKHTDFLNHYQNKHFSMPLYKF